MRELDDDEEEELEDIFDANGAAGKYVWQQSSECLAGNCWAVSWNQPEYWWHDYRVAQLTITSTGRIGVIGLPASLHKAMITAAAVSLHKAMIKAMVLTAAAAAVSLDKATSGLSTDLDTPGRGPSPGPGPGPRARSQSRGQLRGRPNSRPPLRRPPNEPAKAAPKADAYQQLYRGQGARAKRTARRLLLQAGLDVPDSLKPGKAAAPAVGEPGKADAVDEPGKADELPTGDTEESAEEEEDWVTVGDKKKKKKKPAKKTKNNP